jgi:pimeloyl-ACP methyl ester carboxylesterase
MTSASRLADREVRPQRFRHLAYLEAGSAPSTLFLLHGGTMTARWNWEEALPRFAERFHVIAPDSPGHGGSGNPRPDLRYEDVADDVLALAAELGVEHAAFYGFSDGAQVALEIAIREPALPTALALNGVLHKLTPEYHASMQRFVGAFADPVWSTAQPQAAAQCAARHIDWPTLAAQVWELWMRPLDIPLQRLARVAAPTLLLTGDRDPFIPLEQTVELLRHLPSAELAVLPGAGHDYDDRFTRAVLEFLDRHAG